MRYRRSLFALLVSLFSLTLAGLIQPAPAAAGQRLCFTETNQCSENAFLTFWTIRGAAPILGLPLGPAIVNDSGRLVQFYERAIFEWHPQNEPSAQVQLARLGAERLGDRPEAQTPPGPCDPSSCRHFSETNHTVRGAFLSYWQANGGLAVFGLPLTEEFSEADATTGREHIVQYFERSRFELHSSPTGPLVQLGRLGAEAWQELSDLHSRPTVTVPDYSQPIIARPGRLQVPGLGIDAPVEEVGLERSGEMAAPHQAHTVGWYTLGARPGEPGNAVMAGHVDFRGVGPAVFWRLRELTPGAEIWVGDETGLQRRFIVEEIATYRFNDAPLERIFGPTGQVRLNLITCAGSFDAGSRNYDQRLVVYTRWDGTVR